MIKVTVGTTTSRTAVIVEDSKTPKQVLEDTGVDFSAAIVHLDGSALDTKSMNTSFAELNCKETAYLIAVVKQGNA